MIGWTPHGDVNPCDDPEHLLSSLHPMIFNSQLGEKR